MAKAEYLISLILRWGVYLCAVVIASGWLLSFWQGHGLDSIHLAMSGHEIPNLIVPRSLADFYMGLSAGDPQTLIAMGLMLLILLPITRVAASAVIFVFEKDFLFVGMSVVVFSVLIFSLLMGKAI